MVDVVSYEDQRQLQHAKKKGRAIPIKMARHQNLSGPNKLLHLILNFFASSINIIIYFFFSNDGIGWYIFCVIWVMKGTDDSLLFLD